MTLPANFPQEFVAFSYKEQLNLLPCYPNTILPEETTISFKIKAPRFQTSKSKMAWMLDEEFEMNRLNVAAGGPLVFPKWCRGGYLLVFNNQFGQLLQLPLDSSSIQLPPEMELACSGVVFHGGGIGCFTFEVQPSEPPVPTQIAVPNSQASSSNSDHSGSFTSLMNSASSNATNDDSQQLFGSFHWLNDYQGLTLDQRIEQTVTNFVKGNNRYLANLDDVHSTGYTLQDLIDAFTEDDEEYDQDMPEACSRATSPESYSPAVSQPSPCIPTQEYDVVLHSVVELIPYTWTTDVTFEFLPDSIDFKQRRSLTSADMKERLVYQWNNCSTKAIRKIAAKFFGNSKDLCPFLLSTDECHHITPSPGSSCLSVVFLPSATEQAKSKISALGESAWLQQLCTWSAKVRNQYQLTHTPFYYQTLLFKNGKYVMTVNIHLYSGTHIPRKVVEYFDHLALKDMVFIDQDLIGSTLDNYSDVEEMKNWPKKRRFPLLLGSPTQVQNSQEQRARLASSAFCISSVSEEQESITSTGTQALDDLPHAKRHKKHHKEDNCLWFPI